MSELNNQKQLFEETPVLEAILKLAVPAIISQIILVIYNMADTFFIGLAGSDAKISAVTVCMPAFMLLSAISNLFGVGGASVISRALGAQDADRARRTAAFSFWGCAVVTLIYSIWVGLIPDLIVDALGGTNEEVHACARLYLIITVALGGLATSVNTLLAHLIRSEGRSGQAGFGIALGGVLNIALDPLLMFVVFEPGNEILGAALATALSNLLATAYFAAVLLRGRMDFALSFRLRRSALRDGIPSAVLAAGAPACLMTICENLSFAVLDKLMSMSGTVMQAGMGVAKKVNMLAHCVVRGMAQGVLPLIGYNYAANLARRMRSVVRLSMLISAAMASACMLGCLLFSHEMVGWFIRSGSESLEAGARFLRILCLGGPFSACAYAVISFFQATGNGVKSLELALLRKGIIDIPLMFALRRILPIDGIVWATPITDSICCIAALAMFSAFMRRQPGILDSTELTQSSSPRTQNLTSMPAKSKP